MPPNDPEYLEELERTVRRMLDELPQRRIETPAPADRDRERLRTALSEAGFIGALLVLFLVALYLLNAP